MRTIFVSKHNGPDMYENQIGQAKTQNKTQFQLERRRQIVTVFVIKSLLISCPGTCLQDL